MGFTLDQKQRFWGEPSTPLKSLCKNKAWQENQGGGCWGWWGTAEDLAPLSLLGAQRDLCGNVTWKGQTGVLRGEDKLRGGKGQPEAREPHGRQGKATGGHLSLFITRAKSQWGGSRLCQERFCLCPEGDLTPTAAWSSVLSRRDLRPGRSPF